MEIIKKGFNLANNGYYAVFKHNFNYYYADVTNVPFVGSECMIFMSDENGKVTDWGEVYKERKVEVSEKGLMNCIENAVEIWDYA